jgi:microcin C transport system substrate-binding protein
MDSIYLHVQDECEPRRLAEVAASLSIDALRRLCYSRIHPGGTTMIRRLLLSFALVATLTASADETFPKPGWKDAPSPLASPDAVPGGTLVFAADQPPKSLNYYLDNSSFTIQVFDSLFETLLGNDPLTADFVPNLASHWTLSTDKRTFTFTIDPAAKWSDGQPVTAADVKWTFDMIMAPTNQTGPAKVALQTFTNTPPVIVDARTIRFTAGEIHWRNLQALGGFEILPAHVFSNADFNKINFDFPVVSGPYRLGSLKENIELRLERRADWWQWSRPSTRGTLNFQTIVYRFFAEQENAFEAFKKGELDVFPVYMARLWVNEAKGDKFDRHWIVKQRVRNHRPLGFQGFTMNLRRPLFSDLRVRKALALLLDRDKMNRTLMYNAYFLQRSYFEDLYDASQPCTNALYAFDAAQAGKLLDDAGWRANAQTGWREKDGKRLSFIFLTRDASSDKFLALYSEDLKKAGIEIKIDRKDWAAWVRDMEAFQFDMTWAAWGSALFKDPEDMWASSEADRPSGNNYTGFKDARVDALIEKQKTIFDLAERNKICREIDSILTAQIPYVLLWNLDYTRLLYWNKFGTPPTVLGKLGDERALFTYWWYDADSAAELKAATSANTPLPQRPDYIDFDTVFKAP